MSVWLYRKALAERRWIPCRGSTRGFALLIVLWSLATLALLIAHLTAAGRTESRLSRNLRDEAVVEAVADGAVERAMFDLLTRNGAGSRLWYESGSEDGVRVTTRLENLAGRINPNLASPPLLRALLRQLEVDPQRADALADAMLDWSTPGQIARPRGAKLAEYRAAGLPYGPPSAPIQSLDELGAVLGMTPELLARIRPHLTLWSEDEPDAAAADPVVLAALRALGQDEKNPGDEPTPKMLAVDIIAAASWQGGARFVRHAVVGIVPGGGSGPPWRVLEWDTPKSVSLQAPLSPDTAEK